MAGDCLPGPPLAELHVALLLPDGALEDLADPGMVDGVDDRIERHEHEPFAEGHLQAHVLLEARGHHSGREEAHDAVGRSGRFAEQIEDAQEVVDVLELLDGLAREEPRRVEIGRLVQPMAALDAGDLAVQELVDDPAEQGAVALRRQASRPEIERHFLARKQHRSGA